MTVRRPPPYPPPSYGERTMQSLWYKHAWVQDTMLLEDRWPI